MAKKETSKEVENIIQNENKEGTKEEKSFTKLNNDKKVKIIHKMADGTIRDSVDGYVIPYNETTAITYQLLSKWAIERYGEIETDV